MPPQRKILKLSKIPILAVVLPAFFLATVALSDQPEIIKVIHIKGDPQIMKSGKTTWEACKKDIVVEEGDRIRTQTGETAELSFGKGEKNIVTIHENSDVVIIQSTSLDTSIELINGEVFSLIKRLPRKSTFEVRTPAGLCGARGTGLGSKTDGQSMTASAFEKNIFFKGIEKSGEFMKDELIVRAGWKSTIDKFERPIRLDRLSRAEMRLWRLWRRDLRTRLRSSRRRGALDRAGHLGTNVESALERKETFDETRDLDRIEKRQDRGGSSSDRDSGGYDSGGR